MVKADVCVLLVERDPDIRLAFQRDVRALGWGTEIATSPLQVVRCMMRDDVTFGSALVSVGMGEANARQVLAFIADDHPSVRRVILSGRAMVGMAEALITSHYAQALLMTPWTPSALEAVLDGTT